MHQPFCDIIVFLSDYLGPVWDYTIYIYHLAQTGVGAKEQGNTTDTQNKDGGCIGLGKERRTLGHIYRYRDYKGPSKESYSSGKEND